MRLNDAILRCPENGAVYRAVAPTKKYFRNHFLTFSERIDGRDLTENDWEVYDPFNTEETSDVLLR